ncbi:TerB family tellurite resistance protein [Rhizobium sp. CFBP 8762]|uniref:tellurite resistance TerB family protein n=1 Tax=Rhizobium sp. CFBP 8762 TaxID=2775279 RepID=UPI001780BE61|nr:TerB family tellurite resistance protein [Rhizobium sp. CFBP 8762]MBD8555477.1 TerB family tellurite resistance protein [Rhizobium sp. CFBP 8762]
MFERLQKFISSLTSEVMPSTLQPDDPRVAVMALCIQVMEADGKVEDAERRTLRAVIKDRYQLDDAALAELISAGETAESEAIDFYRFTSDIKRQLSEEQRVDLVGMLWEIVYADGERSELEDHMIWRIADLLGVSDRDRVLMRQNAARRSETAVTAGEEER